MSVPDVYPELRPDVAEKALAESRCIMTFCNDTETFDVHETPDGFIGVHEGDAGETVYELALGAIADELPIPAVEIPEDSAEVLTMPLMNSGWEIEFYDAENADERIDRMFEAELND